MADHNKVELKHSAGPKKAIELHSAAVGLELAPYTHTQKKFLTNAELKIILTLSQATNFRFFQTARV